MTANLSNPHEGMDEMGDHLEQQRERAAFEALRQDIVNEFERQLRDYAEGNGHWSKVEAARNALRAALSAAPAIPAGWKPVPVELPQEMIEAFHCEDGEGAANKWAAMLSAAPSAPGTEQAKPVEAQSALMLALLEYFHAAESFQMTLGHPEATPEDENKAEARWNAATSAARAAVAATIRESVSVKLEGGV